MSLRHTKADIETVGKYDMEPGNTYIIQHSKEGLKSIDTKNKNITPAQISDYNTRFRGKFVKYDIGKSRKYPDGIPGEGMSNREVAIFENIEIISKNKKDITDDIYVIFPDPRDQSRVKGLNWLDIVVNDLTPNRSSSKKYEKAVRIILLGIRKNNYKVAFAVNKWTFAESSMELQNEMVENAVGHMAHDYPNPKDRETEEELKKLQKKVFQEGLPGSLIAEFAGINIPQPSPEILAKQEEERREYKEVYG
jgi:hypothetical protein